MDPPPSRANGIALVVIVLHSEPSGIHVRVSSLVDDLKGPDEALPALGEIARQAVVISHVGRVDKSIGRVERRKAPFVDIPTR